MAEPSDDLSVEDRFVAVSQRRLVGLCQVYGEVCKKGYETRDVKDAIEAAEWNRNQNRPGIDSVQGCMDVDRNVIIALDI